MIEQPRKDVVVGVDGSPSSSEALRWAWHQAQLTGDRLVAVSAWQYPAAFGWLPVDDADLGGLARQALVDTVKTVIGEGESDRLRLEVQQGHPSEVLVRLATGARMLVVGSRGHGEFSGLLLGSVSLHAVTHARCPVGRDSSRP